MKKYCYHLASVIGSGARIIDKKIAEVNCLSTVRKPDPGFVWFGHNRKHACDILADFVGFKWWKKGISMRIINTWNSIFAERKAVTALEYGLVAALIAVVIVASVTTLGTSISAQFLSVASTITNASK